MKKVFKTATALGLMMSIVPCLSAQAATFEVTSSQDQGKGSLRAALEAAGTNGQSNVIILTSGDIAISSALRYRGQSPIMIMGQGQTISAQGNHTLFEATQGADVTINNLTLKGPGGYSIENRADLKDKRGAKGIFVDVRDDQSGTVKLTLNGVTVSDVAYHGIHVSDCNLANSCGSGGGGAGEGSAASISVVLNGVTVDNVGQGRFDADGLRVDERGLGDITATLINSTFKNVGADGVELDEGQAGDVIAHSYQSNFMNNGNYCDPAILADFMPTQDEAQYTDNQVTEAEIPRSISGSPDDQCFEREVDLYASGFVAAYEFGIDLDDGFDIDEAGPGSILSEIVESVISANKDEGLDFDEEDAGSITMTILKTQAMNNTDDGYKHSEEGDGGVFAHILNSSAKSNGGKGFVFEEENNGNVTVYAEAVRTDQNDDGDKTGVEVVQADEGTSLFKTKASTLKDGVDTAGVEFTSPLY